MSYQPYRIIREYTVIGIDPAETARRYPNGTMRHRARCVEVRYRDQSVINEPTPEEIELFTRCPYRFAVAIPQHRLGFDQPDSGVARSLKSSLKAQEKATVAEAKERHSKKVNVETRLEPEDEDERFKPSQSQRQPYDRPD